VNFAEQKSHLRNHYRQKRKVHRTDVTYTYLMDSPEFQSARVIASYISYGDEPNTIDLNEAILKSGRTLLLPRVNSDTDVPSLDWVPWEGDTSQLTSRGKMLEPIGDADIRTELIDVVITPALQIDVEGYRLGQGGGYYDRALSQLAAWKVALIFPEEFSSDLLPREEHDIPVNAFATDEKIVRIN
jgi:5-formyltetrahydrofolate cyclo-ligase